MRKDQIQKEIQMMKKKRQNKKFNQQKIRKLKIIHKRKKLLHQNKQGIMTQTKKIYKQTVKKTIYKLNNCLKNKNIR